MQRDGRNVFFRKINLNKDVMKLLSWFIDIKQEMLNEKNDSYENGKISETE